MTYNARFFLRRGEEVSFDADIIERARSAVTVRKNDGQEFVDHSIVLGKRHAIAGVEKSLMGMCAGGYREILVAPRLAYREAGVKGRIPANAMLRIQLWVRAVHASAQALIPSSR